MARGINKVILIGNLGKDPEVRYMANGSAVATLTVATSETWKDKQTGQAQEKTEWHRVVYFNRLGEIAGEYLKKGSKIYVEGSLRTRKWQDQSGQDRWSTEIVGNELQMLDGKGSSGSTLDDSRDFSGFDQFPEASFSSGAPSAPKAPSYPSKKSEPSQPVERVVDFDDDIPF